MYDYKLENCLAMKILEKHGLGESLDKCCDQEETVLRDWAKGAVKCAATGKDEQRWEFIAEMLSEREDVHARKIKRNLQKYSAATTTGADSSRWQQNMNALGALDPTSEAEVFERIEEYRFNRHGLNDVFKKFKISEKYFVLFASNVARKVAQAANDFEEIDKSEEVEPDMFPCTKKPDKECEYDGLNAVKKWMNADCDKECRVHCESDPTTDDEDDCRAVKADIWNDGLDFANFVKLTDAMLDFHWCDQNCRPDVVEEKKKEKKEKKEKEEKKDEDPKPTSDPAKLTPLELERREIQNKAFAAKKHELVMNHIQGVPSHGAHHGAHHGSYLTHPFQGAGSPGMGHAGPWTPNARRVMPPMHTHTMTHHAHFS